ncbi:unnamed protein product, partial [marine sediment metagenome]
TTFDHEIECPECGAVFPVARVRSGREEPCPVCRTPVRVPDAGASVPVEEPAPEPSPAPKETPFRATLPPREGAGVVVCAAPGQKLNPIEVGAIVSSFTGLPQRDARLHVRRGMGLLAEGLTPDAARSMLRALRNKGVEAFGVPEPFAGRPAQRLPLFQIYGADEGGLHVQVDREGTVRSAGWSTLVAGVCTRAMYGHEEVTEAGPDRGRRLVLTGH